MSAMDKMIAQMLGINPQELGQMIEDFRGAIVAVQAQQNRIEEKLDLILAERNSENVNSGTEQLDGDSNGDSNGAGRRAPNRRRGNTAGSGAE